jgi:glucosyl-3-phosphoglycerate synthase
LWTSLVASTGDLVVWCDADLEGVGPELVERLVTPLLADDGIAFVKGRWSRSLDGRDGEGGRVTELLARPLLERLFPELAGIAEPLAGECAGRRTVLERVPFEAGYGVDIGLLVDVARLAGPAAIAQVDLGVRVHRNRPLAELGSTARQVLHVALARAGVPVAPLPAGRPPVADYRLALDGAS